MPLVLQQTGLYRLLETVLSHAWSGDGVIRGALSELAVSEQGTPGMTVQAASGYAWAGRRIAGWTSAKSTGTIAAPITNDRVDLVQVLSTGALDVKAGTEAAVPSAPSADTDAVPLATILLTPTTTEITDSDITDAREYA